MRISVGADERNSVVEHVLWYLEQGGHDVKWHVPLEDKTLPWPDVARAVAEDVSLGRSDEGILFCWTGTGVSIAANKVKGIRAALCVDAGTAYGAKLWNNANVLCFSLRLTSEPVAEEILKSWFGTTYKPNPQDDACLKSLKELEELTL